MDIRKDFLPRVKEEKCKDETLSYTGQPDFTKAEPDIKTLNPRLNISRPRTKASINNSYT